MPFRWIAFQRVRVGGRRASARSTAQTSASGRVVAELEAGRRVRRLVRRRRPCRSGRRWRGRSGPCRSAGCTSGSARRARTTTASGTCRLPASMRCASRSSKPIRAATRSGCRAGQLPPQVLAPAVAAAEHHPGRVERHQSIAPRRATRSQPFWCVSRVTMPISGRAIAASSSGRPAASSSARFTTAFRSSVPRVEVRRQVPIGRGIPRLGVDAVEDADEIRARGSRGCR